MLLANRPINHQGVIMDLIRQLENELDLSNGILSPTQYFYYLDILDQATGSNFVNWTTSIYVNDDDIRRSLCADLLWRFYAVLYAAIANPSDFSPEMEEKEELPAKDSRRTDKIDRHTKSQFNYILFYFNTRKCIEVDKKKFKFLRRNTNAYYRQDLHNKILIFDIPEGEKGKLKTRFISHYIPENIFDDIGNFTRGLSSVITLITQVGQAANGVENGMNIIKSKVKMSTDQLLAVIRKILAYALHCFNTFKQSSNPGIMDLINLLLEFYNIYADVKVYRAESLDAVALAALSLVLPPKLFEILKRMSTFTSLKLLDDMHIIETIISGVQNFIVEVLLFFKVEDARETVNSIFKYIPFGRKSVLLQQINEVINMYKVNPRVMSEDTFQLKVESVFANVNEDIDFTEWSKRSQMVKNLLGDLTTLHKKLQSYKSAIRMEPVCFVFEGPPGCNKSVFMSKLTDSLSKLDNKRIYSHLVKSIKDGKDWYDSYNNEDVFLMDDVGQQGVSQWRTIINMVSPLRLPLDCAEAKLKDTKFFSSELIMITTNAFMKLRGFTKDDCISHPSALWRRAFVFDFSLVKMDQATGLLTGDISFKYYDWQTSKWLNQFPPYVTAQLPTTHSSESITKAIAWMRIITKVLLAYRKKFCEDAQLTNSQIDTIDQETDSFLDYKKFEQTLGLSSTTETKTEHVDLTVTFNAASETVKGDILGTHDEVLLQPGPLVSRNTIKVLALPPDLAKPKSQSQSLNIFSKLTGYKPEAFSEVFRQCKQWMKEFYLENIKYYIDTILEHIKEFKFETSLTLLCMASTIALFITHKYASKKFDPQAKYEKLRKLMKHEHNDLSLQFLEKQVRDFDLTFDTPKVYRVSGFVSGHYVVLPSHAVLKDEFLLRIYNGGTRSSLAIDYIPVKQIFRDESHDVSIVQLPPKQMTPFKSLSHFLKGGSTNNFTHLVTVAGSILLADIVSPRPTSTICYSYNTATGTMTNYLTPSNSVHYDLSEPSLCGSFLYNGTTICGMHVAGDGKGGTSMIWSDDFIFKLKNILEKDEFILNVDFKETQSFESGIKMDYHFSESTPKSSSYVPSPLYDVFPNSREPANMLYDGPHTIKTVMKKNLKPNKPIELGLYQEALKGLDLVINDFTPMTEAEIVNGTDNIARLNPKSSNGLFCEDGKSTYIDYENSAFTDKLKGEIEEIEQQITRGEIPMELAYVKSTLKDEIRNVEKEGKPRGFQITTIHLQVLTKKYFGNMVKHIVENRKFNKICVGINPYVEWNDFYKELRACLIVFDLDFRDWDGGMLAAIQSLICEFLMKKFKGTLHEAKIAEFVIRTLIWKILVCNDDAVFVTHGLPSGSFLTAIFNSLLNLLNGIAWFVKNTKLPATYFFTYVKYYTYGDDVTVGVMKNEKVLNALTFAKHADDIGIGCTTASKAEVTEVSVPLQDIIFLKRKFYFNSSIGRVVGTLDKRTLYSGLSWLNTNTTDSMDKVMRDKISSFQREMFLYGRYEFDKAIATLDKACKERGVDYDPLNYDYLTKLYAENPGKLFEEESKKYSLV